MKKRIQKKSEVLREGYIKGLREGMKVVNKVIRENENAELLDEGMLGQACVGVKSTGKKLGSNFAGRKRYNDNLSVKENGRALTSAEAKGQKRQSNFGEIKQAFTAVRGEAEEETDNAEDIAELCAESWDWRRK